MYLYCISITAHVFVAKRLRNYAVRKYYIGTKKYRISVDTIKSRFGGSIPNALNIINSYW